MILSAYMTTIDYIKNYLTSLNIKVSSVQEEQINSLTENMLKDPLYKSVSKISEPEEIAVKHFLDCLIPFSADMPSIKGKNIIDLGTGGGFPGLVFAIMLPESVITTVDARQKSIDFVLRMADLIGLKNVKGIHSRIEDLGREMQYREKADIVVCRALSAVRTLVEYTFPLVKTGRYSVFLKGPKLEEELNEAQNAFKIFGISSGDITINSVSEPIIPFERNIVRIKKNVSCPDKYPRKSGMPTAKPL